MTLIEQVKILDDKIKTNKVAKISALSIGELKIYEYLSGEHLGHSPLGKVFNKGLDERDKKEGLLKRLKNIEDKSEEQLKMIENKKTIN